MSAGRLTPARSMSEANVCRLCFMKHSRHWTKPQGGIHDRRESGATHAAYSQLSTIAKAWRGCMQQIPFRKGAFHDTRSATNDRGYASAESVAAHASLIHP